MLQLSVPVSFPELMTALPGSANEGTDCTDVTAPELLSLFFLQTIGEHGIPGDCSDATP